MKPNEWLLNAELKSGLQYLSVSVSWQKKGWTLLLRPILVLAISLKPGNRVETLIHYKL